MLLFPATPPPSSCVSYLDRNRTFPKLPFPSSLCSTKSSMVYFGAWSFLGTAYTGSASVSVNAIEMSAGPSQETPCSSGGNCWSGNRRGEGSTITAGVSTFGCRNCGRSCRCQSRRSSDDPRLANAHRTFPTNGVTFFWSSGLNTGGRTANGLDFESKNILRAPPVSK